MMTVYVVASLTKTNDDDYAEYVRIAQQSLAKYPDSRIAADDAPRLVEGTMPAPRFVILKFKDEPTFDEWYSSDAYQEAIPHRLRGSEMNFMLLAKGHA